MTQDSALAQAESLLLTPFSLTEGDLSRTFGQILTHQVDYADLYFQYSRSEAWSLDEGIVKSGSFNIDQGVGVRAISGEKTAFAYSDDISSRALGDAPAPCGRLPRPGRTAFCRLFRRRPQARSLYVPHDPIASLPAEAKVKLLERLEGFARALDPRVIQVMASLAGEYEVILVAGSDGRLAADIRPLVRCSVSVIVEENGKREQGGAGGGGRFDFGYFDDEVLQRYAKEAVHQASPTSMPSPAPAGR
jgi:TldD protein